MVSFASLDYVMQLIIIIIFITKNFILLLEQLYEYYYFVLQVYIALTTPYVQYMKNIN